MNDMERLEILCQESLTAHGLGSQRERLALELREIDAQNEAEYILDVLEKGHRYHENPNNLLVYYLLGITPGWDRDSPPVFIEGEMPDIDVDFVAPVREYLRQEWAPKHFGEEYVCAIGNYNTFQLKSSFLDMTRVHGLDLKEIQIITKSLEAKDGDGKALTFDKALEEYDELRSYCEHHPDIKDAVKRILHRNRAMGTHAGGLVISSKRIDDFVPLVRGKDDAITSAWTEGLHGQDLGPMGLIKFDILGITDLMRIALACKLVKERHGLDYICSDPKVNRDWSDTSYLNDPKALGLAKVGDMLGIFQFDSPGIRKLCKESGVTSFEDLVAYSALYRPGPLGQGMHTVYGNRKNGRDDSHLHLHPILQRILGKTYGVMVYQEQVMQILHAVGDIPLKDCEACRKAISKKQIDKFIKYKTQFIERGQKNLGWNEEQVEELFSQVEAFSSYGFNKSILINTVIPTPHGNKKIQEFVPGDWVYGVNQQGDTVEVEVVAIHDHGVLDGYCVTFDDGYTVNCTLDHKFLTEDGQKSLREICGTNSSILCDAQNMESVNVSAKNRMLDKSLWGVGLVSEHAPIANIRRLVRRKIVRVVPMGKGRMYDLEVASTTHNFLLANGVVTSNSHSVAYTYISSRLLYLKAHYPLEFYCATLTCEKTSDKIKEYKRDAVSHGRNIDVVPIDINLSKADFHIEGDRIFYGLADIKGIGGDMARRIVAGQPYKDLQDFLERFGTDASVVKPFVELGVFGMDRDRKLRYYNEYRDHFSKIAARDKRFLESKERYKQRLIDELGDIAYYAEIDWDNMESVEAGIMKLMDIFTDDKKKAIQKAAVTYIRRVEGHDIKVTTDRFQDLGVFDIGSIERAEDAWSSVERAIVLSAAEVKHYGFRWMHPLEISRRYSGGRTFEDFRRAVENNENEFYVEVMVTSCQERVSKKGTVYHSLTIEDSNSETQKMNIWDNDWERFGKFLSMWVDPDANPEDSKDPRNKPVGNMLRILLTPPDPKFPMYNLKSWPKHLYSRLAPKDYSMDFRVVVMEYARDWSKW